MSWTVEGDREGIHCDWGAVNQVSRGTLLIGPIMMTQRLGFFGVPRVGRWVYGGMRIWTPSPSFWAWALGIPGRWSGGGTLGEGGDAAWRFFWENEEEDQFQGIGAELVIGGRERAEWWLELGTIPSDPRLWHRPVWTLRN